MNRLSVVLTAVLLAAVALPGRARACKPIGQTAHILDPSMAASDQTPPTLPAVPPPQIQRGDGSDQGGCAPKCGGGGSILFVALATDDQTPPLHIGYRFTLTSGALPAGFTLPTVAIEPGLILLWGADDGGDAIDFTLQVVAIDLAGNESAPQTVRVRDDSGMACAIGRGGAGRGGSACVALLALLVAASRRRRRRTP